MLNVYRTESRAPSDTCIIWMHGLGADASDMQGLAAALPQGLTVNHVFLDAPVRPVTLNNGQSMRAWFDIMDVGPGSREDTQGLTQSESMIREVMQEEINRGIAPQNLFLAGFSQGGAMALFTGLRTEGRLGGVIALSSWLPETTPQSSVLSTETPIFLGLGRYDPLVLPAWTRLSADMLKARGYDRLCLREYAVEHGVCPEEVTDIAHWLRATIEETA
ncbi:carboxylesterase/phospholipase [Legionella geestiana]|uniref:Carboxylesterase/phospholipase n=1 Tax=Legionella geestiana TaxID=45065 RepID=A0A0W0U8R1_9GAMM|nr:carboxylesterase/phospholipase [Legionella geestiana]STX53195.1 carboxylesterase/phospholipase [Legionella geestiana]